MNVPTAGMLEALAHTHTHELLDELAEAQDRLEHLRRRLRELAEVPG